MDDSDDSDGSLAPDPVGDAVGAQHLPAAAGGGGGGPPAAPQHPVWAAAAGRGRSAAKNKPGSMFGPISMMELELRGRNDLDGASSTASDRGGGGGPRDKDASKRSGKKAKNKKRPREYDDEGADSQEGENDDADSGIDDDVGSSASLDMAGAAFGGGGAASKKRACAPCASEVSDDGVSVTSSVARARHKRAFPVTGVTCVGCALPAKITSVTDFIAKNMSTMSELSLFKMAALVYKTKVADPAEEEGVDVPVRLPLKPKQCWTVANSRVRLPYLRMKAVGLEGDPRALPAALGRLAHAALREHSHALGDAQDPRDAAAAPRHRDGRAVARQEQRRGHHEDHRRQQPRAHAPRRPQRHQEARVKWRV